MFDSIQRTARWYAAAAATLLLISCGGSSNDTPDAPPLFSKVYVLGTSTTDNGGNGCAAAPADYCPPSPPYAAPRLSNGLLFNELLAARYGASMTASRVGGTNFAYSGARTGPIAGTTQKVPNLVAQLDQYLASVNYQSNPQYLYIVDGVAFGNDVSDALALSATNPNAPTQVVVGGVTNVAGIITRLYASGARHILVVNSTDVGKTPKARAAGAVASAGATQMSLQFNGALAQQVAALRATSPGLNLYLLDLGAFTAEAQANPAAFGYTNVTDSCFNDLLATPTLCSSPGTYFYWDSFHGTATTNNLVYQRAVKLLPI
jgi:phospholipase/lecithinase/hemolysin